MNNNYYSGSCLCEKVRFKITGKLNDIVHCHCSRCRKAQGGAFATNANVSSDDFQFISGEGELTGFELQTGHTKYFCKHCGSPIFSKNINSPNFVRVRLGTIESDITERPQAHIFSSSKANWDEISDDVPQFESYENEE